MESNGYRLIDGNIVRGEDLRLPRAKSIYRAIQGHVYINATVCRRMANGNEVIFARLLSLEIPDNPVYPIQDEEDIAIICDVADLFLPEVYAIRKDFPIGLPHSNAKPFQHPVSICVSDVSFSDLRLQFNATGFLENIRRWFNLNSIGKLHEENRPLEIYFQSQECCCLLNYKQGSKIYARYEKKTDHTSTLEFVDRNEATHFIISITVKDTVAQNLAYLPKKVGDLRNLDYQNGITLRDEILGILSKLPSKRNLLKIMVLLAIPLKRENDGEIEEQHIFLIKIDVSLHDIYNKHRVLSEDYFEQWFDNLPIEVIMLMPPVNPITNRNFNGVTTKYDKIVLIGVGTLGSNVLDHILRQGLCDEINIIDFDYFFPHNLARHVLPAMYVMLPKVNALKSHYQGIVGQKIFAHNTNIQACATTHLKELFSGTDLIIDASTSPSVERMLAFCKERDKSRACCIFMNPQGTDLVFFMENEDRQQRLDLLEMSYLRELITNPELASHLSDVDKLETSVFNCRSISNIIDYDNVGILSSIASQQIKLCLKTEGSLSAVWRINTNDSQVNKIAIQPLEWSRFDCDGIAVYMANVVIEEMHSMSEAIPDAETGGCLFGSMDKDRNVLYIFYQQPASDDSVHTPTSFIRGCKGMKDVCETINKKTYYQVTYLGEWHSHPNSNNNPSSVDDGQFYELSEELSQESMPFVQCILGNNGVFARTKM